MTALRRLTPPGGHPPPGHESDEIKLARVLAHIASSDWAKTPEGSRTTRKLEQLYRDGKLSIQDLDKLPPPAPDGQCDPLTGQITIDDRFRRNEYAMEHATARLIGVHGANMRGKIRKSVSLGGTA
jgi:hypothetical protein